MNPRLPAQLQGADQVTLLRYLSDNGVLDELIQSFADNGFFTHEPLIGFRGGDRGITILEGNRRLAALMVLLGLPEARDLRLEPQLKEAVSPERLAAASRSACLFSR